MNKVQNARRPRGRGQKRGKPGNGGNRNDHRVKGNPKQLIDKYKSLARDALQAGDRILAENYLQHADHYQRVWNERYGAPEPAASEAAGDEGDGLGMTAPARRSRSQRAAAADTAPAKPAKAAPDTAPAQADEPQPPLPGAAASPDAENAGETATSAPARPRRRRRPARSAETAAELPSPELAGE